MSTGNFYNKNASKIYAVLMNYERPILDEEDNETSETEVVSPEEWEIDCLLGNLLSELEPKDYYQINRWDNNMNFAGRYFAEKTVSKNFAGTEFYVKIIAVLRGAYYEGANLDWEVETIVDCLEVDEPDEGYIKNELVYNGLNAGLATIQARNACKWLENTRDELIAELEKVYEMYCEHKLVVSATFSNGETIYNKID